MFARLSLAALMLCLATFAFAMPSTIHFDDLTTEVGLRQAALPTEGLTKDQKKERKALKQYDKAVAKDHDALLKDVKTGAKVDKALNKVYADVEMLGLLDALLSDLGAEVDDRFNDLDTRVNDLPAAKPGVKALKARDKAQTLLGDANTAIDRKSAYKLYKKALQKIRSGEKQVTKAENGGGNNNGGGDCTGRSPTGGEFARFFDGGGVGTTQQHQTTTVTRDGTTAITEFRLLATSCVGNRKVGYEIVIEGEPTVGTYRFGTIGGTRGYAVRVTGNELNLFLIQSVVEITAYDPMTGVVVGSVTVLDNDDDDSVSMDFRSETGL